MIQAVIFDLDGTLVQTEELKAETYAHAAVELSPDHLTEAYVLEHFQDVVGMPREQLAEILLKRFNLEAQARARMAEFGAATPEEAFLQVRIRYYDAMLNNPPLIRAHAIPHNIVLLRSIRQQGYKTGLATMSYRDQVDRILRIVDCDMLFDDIATVEDVKHGKPDPEIYLLVAKHLNAAPEACMVIEDSPIGVEAGVAAGMRVVAVSTHLTKESLHALKSLDAHWIVDDPNTLMDVVQRRITE